MNPCRTAIDVDRIFRIAARKLARFAAASPERIRYPTEAKGAEWTTVAAHDWESGFFPGALWYVSEHAALAGWSDAGWWSDLAGAWTNSLSGQQFNDSHHDLGFVIFNSFGNGYRLTGNPEFLKIILLAADTLATRYRKETGMIRSWGRIDDSDRFTVIMDNMMNLEMLLWAADHGGPNSLREIAVSHADRTMELFFRPDGGTCHVMDLDPRMGSVLRRYSDLGKSADSSWSRGQAWAIHGFTSMYQATRDHRYLDTALLAADYYFARTPPDHVPPADFDGGLDGMEFKDSSAAAIVAAALLRLQPLLDPADPAWRHGNAAGSILHTLTSPPWFSDDAGHAGLLRFGARNYCQNPAHRLTNTSLIWGDYYLLEALLGWEKSKLPAASTNDVCLS